MQNRARSFSMRAADITDLPWIILRNAGQAYSYLPAAAGVLWCATSFASLMIFRQSMRRCRVRVVHVLRVWVHSVVLFLPVAVTVFFFLMIVADVAMALFVRDVLAPWVFFLGVFGSSVWLIREGYKHYLRMDHSLGVAFASQVIAWLAVPALLTACRAFWD